MKAAQFIARCLEDEGVKYIFGVPGEEYMDLLDASENLLPTQRLDAITVPIGDRP
jgi:acetolactate synthase-1/2/3 large subunit